ncbi:hypothetical protein ACIGO9_14900 [Nocardia asteroides]|uniref:hypothetical protein n=1 Tax=Nocardia asteroides TaxID=1824 RepID=UPI0037C9F83F
MGSDTRAPDHSLSLPGNWKVLSGQERLAAAEESARRAGADQGWVRDARTVGTLRADGRGGPVVRHSPHRSLGLEVLLVDMLDRDLWLLERMAALHVGRDERITAGRWQAGTDPDREELLIEHLHVRYSRAAHIVLSVQITPAEGELLWGSGAEDLRRDHARVVEAMSEAELSSQWRAFADDPARLRTRGYVREDPETGRLLFYPLTEPPGPQALIAAATEAQHTVRITDQPVAEADDATTAAVQATGADAGSEWSDPSSPHTPDPHRSRGSEHDRGVW